MRATLSLFVLVLLVAAGGPLEAQGAYEDSTGFPEEPIAGHIRGLLGAFESGDPDVAWRFIEGHFAPAFREDPPKDVHLRVFADVYESSRGYDFVGIRHYTAGAPPNRTVAIVRNRLTEAWEAFVLETESAPPHRIVSLNVTAARPPSHLPAPVALDLEQVGPALREFAQRMADADVFSGALLLARGDRVLLQGAWGQASKRYSVPNRVDTKFNLGSMNKMITAVAVAKLVETLVAPKPALSSPGYGYGFDAGGEPGDRIVGHSGGFPGISSNLDIYLDSGFVAIVLSNYSGGSQAIQQKMRELIARVPR